MNRLKEALVKRDLTFGTWLQIPSPVVAEIVAQNSEGKLDWMCIDMEHGSIGLETMTEMIKTIECYGITPIVRVPSNDYIWIHRSLDAGAKGIVVPMVKRGVEAEFAYRECMYPPEGTRSFGYSRANNYGLDFAEYIQDANRDIAVIVQIEHINAIDNLREILNVPVDATFIGPLDLAGSMGCIDCMNGEKFLETLEEYRDRSDHYGVPTGMHIIHPNPGNVRDAVSQGYKMIAIGLDDTLLSSKCRVVFGRL